MIPNQIPTEIIDAVQREASDFETFIAEDGIRSIRFRASRTLPQEAEDIVRAVWPLIEAAVLDDAADAWFALGPDLESPVADWLHRRAETARARMEGK